jgi:type IV pilus assembly protein PilW
MNASRVCARKPSAVSGISSQAGLSLIELMIAIALGLVLTLGVVQIYLSGSQTYRQNQGFAHAQESARFVSAVLTPELRSAGSFGCLAEMGLPFDQVVNNRLNGILPVPLQEAIQGWEFTGTAPGDAITLADAIATPDADQWDSGTGGADLPADLAGSVLTGSDVIIINSITSINIAVDSANPQGNSSTINLEANSGVPAGRIILATIDDCSRGELFQKSNAPNESSVVMGGVNNNPGPGNDSDELNLNYDSETRVHEFTSMAYYIGEGTNGEPALFRRLMLPLQDPQELVSGVETLQILYGVDTNATRGADDYIPADEVDDWSSVVSVRFSAMTRSPENVLDVANNRNFEMLGSEISQGNNADRRARLISISTTAFRGRM